MAYVFDTSSFSVIGNYYPEQFPTFWEKFDQAATAGTIISVREVRREMVFFMINYPRIAEGGTAEIFAWDADYRQGLKHSS